MAEFDYTIVGGGIVGLAAAMHVAQRFTKARVLVLEKETTLAAHQTGRNSGVIHSGIYYKPGSFKARFAKAGADSMVEFCKTQGIPFQVCGKLIVATQKNQLPQLANLYERGLQNGVPVEKIPAERAREVEPHVNCIDALLVKSTGITSYRHVCDAYLREFKRFGGELRLGTTVRRTIERGTVHVIETNQGEFETSFLINCAGLYSDRVANAAGTDPKAKIIPFRGEYYELTPERRNLVQNLIYPVPHPAFPFLGVHFTKMIDGSVHCGPNAVLALAREGYRKTDVNIRDLAETLMFPGFHKLAAKHYKEGLGEIIRSLSKAAFTRSLQELIPEVTEADLLPCTSGIRAQALMPDGKLVDDFLILTGRQTIHVCNAPSPAATASLEIGREIASQVPPVASTTALTVPPLFTATNN
ncbi:MAG TPA: L-2-hydroxyglutarate oxidase [Chthoniobacterales bacterium]